MVTQPLHRRTFLRGVGITLGLPLLDAMAPALRTASAAAIDAGNPSGRPVRMACIFFPNGAIMPQWAPQGEGKDWQLGPTLEPLAGMKKKLNVISGLALDNGRAKQDGAGDHARCGATFLTAARPVKTAANIRLGVSVDQLAAQQIGNQTKLPSIELGIDDSRNAGSCDSGYSCAYSSNISWRNESQPMSKETVPRMAFERLFGAGGDATARRERDFYRKSILDVVSHDAKALLQQVGDTDRRKLDEYFTSVRELEQRIERTEQEDRAARPDFDTPEGRPEQFEEHVRLMYDLMVLAFQTDTTRIATFMLGNAGSNQSFKQIGVNDGHHQLSHHRNHEEKIAKIRKIDRYLVENFAYFLERLDSIPEGNGTLLDQSIVLYGSGLSDGNRHRHEDLPIVLAGNAGGQWETGRHIKLGEETPMANLFMSLLDSMGAPVESIGDSTGRLPI